MAVADGGSSSGGRPQPPAESFTPAPPLRTKNLLSPAATAAAAAAAAAATAAAVAVAVVAAAAATAAGTPADGDVHVAPAVMQYGTTAPPPEMSPTFRQLFSILPTFGIDAALKGATAAGASRGSISVIATPAAVGDVGGGRVGFAIDAGTRYVSGRDRRSTIADVVGAIGANSPSPSLRRTTVDDGRRFGVASVVVAVSRARPETERPSGSAAVATLTVEERGADDDICR